jgi:hypothetical protein
MVEPQDLGDTPGQEEEVAIIISSIEKTFAKAITLF